MKKALVSMLLVLTMTMTNTIPVLAVSQNVKAKGPNLYVSTKGDDSNDGSINSPFRTLEGARDYIRDLKKGGKLPKKGINVHIREGEYVLDKSFELSSEDSGLEDAPIVYKAYKNEDVRITGGYTLDATEFEYVTDTEILDRLDSSVSDKVMQLDLAEQGITEYGSIPKSGFGWDAVPVSPELFIDGETATISRYPNEGFLTTGNVIQRGFIPRDHETDTDHQQPEHECPPRNEWINQSGPIFNYTDDKLDKWAKEDEVWLFGYWKWDWADDNLQVTMDTQNNTFTAVHPSRYGMERNKRYYAYNLLCEVDKPGEWYLDRSLGILYIYPKGDIRQSNVQLSVLDQPLVNMNEADNIIFENLTFEISRSHGIQMMNGENNLVAGCTFRQLGEKAVKIGDADAPGVFDGTVLLDSEAGGGRNNGVVSCDIYDTGSGGIAITGGNRETLEPGNNYAHNNKIYNYARVIRTYRPAIDLVGVGNRATNNLIYDAPHMAIQFRGNNLLIENNEIYDVCKETADAGVIYTARDWSYRGNIINNNFIHDISTLGGLGSYAVYFDDLMSSATMTNNVFYNIDNSALLLGGGRDFVIENNMFINCRQTAHIDNRGEGWAYYHAEGPKGTCYVTLKNVIENVEHDIWREQYGDSMFELWDMANVDNARAAKIPANNTFRNNISYNGGTMNVASSATTNGDIQEPIKVMADENIGFVDESGLNFSLKKDSIIFEKLPEFKSIDFNQIGLMKDEYRTIKLSSLEPFEIISPVYGEEVIDPLNVVFEWEEVTGANTYELVLATDKHFNEIVSKDIIKTTRVNKQLQENKTYYGKVIASTGSYSLMCQSESEIIQITVGKVNYNLEESFEEGLINWKTQKGDPKVSNEIARTGEYSLKISGEYDVIEKTFGENLNGVVSGWYYDDMAETQRKSHLMNVSDGSNWIGLGVDTSKNGGKTNYIYRIEGTYYPSQVNRSEGWHQFKWDYSSGEDVKLYIDDELVTTTNIVNQFNKIELGDFWQADLAVGYYDDLSIVVNDLSSVVDESQLTLRLPEEVKNGDVLEVILGVEGMKDLVYSQDVTVKYDPKIFTLLEEDRIEAIEPAVYVESDEKRGRIRILLETENGIKDGDIVTLRFKANTKSTVETEIVVTDIQLGMVKDEIPYIESMEDIKGAIVIKKEKLVLEKNEYNAIVYESEELVKNSDIGTDPGQYSQEAKDRLDKAIEEAKQVVEISEDQKIINEVTNILKEAIKNFKDSIIKNQEGNVEEEVEEDVGEDNEEDVEGDNEGEEVEEDIADNIEGNDIVNDKE